MRLLSLFNCEDINMKKFVALLLALSMTAVLGACSGDTTTEEAPAEETTEAPAE